MNRLDMKTRDILEDNIEKIANIFPNAIVETEKGRAIDFETLKQELSGQVVEGYRAEKYQLTWPGRNRAILEANLPITKTLRPYKGESINFDDTKNLYIEGENLEVLKILQESYLNKIKCIYIDPPYNTGNDFIYADNYSKSEEEELSLSGQIDEYNNRLVSNTDSNGRFHSDWLSMMYPRLKLARNLLTQDGVIFISIDDNEVYNLRKMCDEIYGERNYINMIAVKTKASAGASGGGEDKRLKKNTEFILMYAKDRSSIDLEMPVRYNKIEDVVEEHKQNEIGFYYTRIVTDFGKKKLVEEIDGMKIYEHEGFSFSTVAEKMKKEKLTLGEVYNKYFDKIFMVTNAQTSLLTKVNKVTPESQMLMSYEYVPRSGKDKNKKITKYIWNKTLMVWLADSAKKMEDGVYKADQIGTLWDDISWGRLDLQGKVSFKNGKKPLRLIDRILTMFQEKDYTVLDFFSGSATTAEAVMRANAQDGGNRKFIIVQIPEKCDQKSENYKEGYRTICELGKTRIQKAIEEVKEQNAKVDYGYRDYKVDTSNMKNVYYEPTEITQEQLDMFATNIKEDRTGEDLLTQVILDLGLTLDLKIEEKNICKNKVYFVEDNKLVACFDDTIETKTIDKMLEDKPSKVIFKDSSFERDTEKINVSERIKKLSVETQIIVI